MSPRRYLRRTLPDRHRPRVLDVAPGLVHESGPRPEVNWAPQRVAIVAHFSTDPEPTRSVLALTRELAAAGYETVLVSAAEAPGPIERVCTWAPQDQAALPERTTVLRRANVGYDFGSWASVLSAFPGIRRAPRVLLVNDSLIGPFASLAPMLADFEAAAMPVWGLTGSLQHCPHIQSFFVGYRDGVLDSPALRAFWTDIRVESRKTKIVRYEELGLSEALDEAGIGWQTLFEPAPDEVQNPTINYWRSLLERGFPFVKGELVVSPPHWLEEWDQVGSVLRAAWGQDLIDWIPPGRKLSGPAELGTWGRIMIQARSVADVQGPVAVFPAGAHSLQRRWARMRGGGGTGGWWPPEHRTPRQP